METPDGNDAPHHATRALDIARGLRDTFGLGVQNVVYLLKRWRDRADVPLQDRALGLIAAAACIDAAQPPVTLVEVRGLVADLRAHFGDDRERMRSELAAYLTYRGATAAQRLRADVMLRDAWHAHRSSTTPHIEKAA